MFSQLPIETLHQIFNSNDSVTLNKTNLLDLNSFLKEKFHGYNKFTFSKELNNGIVNRLYDDLAKHVINELGIVLKEGVNPWPAYKNSKEFLIGIKYLLSLDFKKDFLEIQNFLVHTKDPIFPHLIYILTEISSERLSEIEKLKLLAIQKITHNASKKENISSLFVLACQQPLNLDHQNVKNAIQFLQLKNIYLKNEDILVFLKAFSFNFNKAADLCRYVMQDNGKLLADLREKLTFKQLYDLLANLALCINPKQALDMILTTDSLHKFLNDSDVNLIHFMGWERHNGNETINAFLREVSETIPHIKRWEQKSWPQDRVNEFNQKYSDQLTCIWINQDRLNQHPIILKFINGAPEKTKKDILENYLKIIFLINYPNWIFNYENKKLNSNKTNLLTHGNIKQLSEEKITIFLQESEKVEKINFSNLIHLFDLKNKKASYYRWDRSELFKWLSLYHIEMSTPKEDVPFLIDFIKKSEENQKQNGFILMSKLDIAFAKLCTQITTQTAENTSYFNLFCNYNPEFVLKIISNFIGFDVYKADQARVLQAISLLTFEQIVNIAQALISYQQSLQNQRKQKQPVYYAGPSQPIQKVIRPVMTDPKEDNSVKHNEENINNALISQHYYEAEEAPKRYISAAQLLQINPSVVKRKHDDVTDDNCSKQRRVGEFHTPSLTNHQQRFFKPSDPDLNKNLNNQSKQVLLRK